MLTKEQIADAAQRLDDAERARRQIGQLSLQYPQMTIEDGYAIQKSWVAAKIAAGRTMVGHKIGLTSKAMQSASQISEPDFGTLLDDMVFADGTDIPMARFIVPMVEVELAFILGRRLEGANVTIFDVLSATDY
ncbi:MAG: 2-oxo-hepta-3-ene-1,7-dioic acid hydratase, partial [Betaproteobacteria bacterium]